jgi:hypothetical protein
MKSTLLLATALALVTSGALAYSFESYQTSGAQVTRGQYNAAELVTKNANNTRPVVTDPSWQVRHNDAINQPIQN